MANEASIFIETHYPIDFTVANATAITKGSILAHTDPFTAIAATTDNPVVAGIAAADKIASDGVTKLAVWRDGIFKVTLSGTCNVGDPLGVFGDGSNKVGSIIGSLVISGSRTLGTALETGTNGETIFMELRPQTTSYLVV